MPTRAAADRGKNRKIFIFFHSFSLSPQNTHPECRLVFLI
jgi:hypothetical protein